MRAVVIQTRFPTGNLLVTKVGLEFLACNAQLLTDLKAALLALAVKASGYTLSGCLACDRALYLHLGAAPPTHIAVLMLFALAMVPVASEERPSSPRP